MSDVLPVVDKIYKGAARLLRGRHNVKTHNRKLERAIRDHLIWVRRRDQELIEELARLGSEFASRGTYQSGARIAAERRTKREAINQWELRRRNLEDLLEDLESAETWIENLHRRKAPMPNLSIGPEEDAIVTSWRGSA